MGWLNVWQVSAMGLVNPSNVGSQRPLSETSIVSDQNTTTSVFNVTAPSSGDPPPPKAVKVTRIIYKIINEVRLMNFNLFLLINIAARRK